MFSMNDEYIHTGHKKWQVTSFVYVQCQKKNKIFEFVKYTNKIYPHFLILKLKKLPLIYKLFSKSYYFFIKYIYVNFNSINFY